LANTFPFPEELARHSLAEKERWSRHLQINKSKERDEKIRIDLGSQEV